MIDHRRMYIAFVIMICIQTIYLSLQFYHFQWYFIDDLLTLELINKNSLTELYSSFLSGVNVFPPIYFLICYFITNTLGLSEYLLVWINLPAYIFGIYFCYKSLKIVSTPHISILAVTIMCTVKCSILPYINQVRPYTFYYSLTALLLYLVLKYKERCCKKVFWGIFFTFQMLSQSHYYGFGIGLLICFPLLFINQNIKQKLQKVTIISFPSLLVNMYFLLNQLEFTYSGDLLKETSLKQIYIIYSSFFHSTIVIFLAITLTLIIRFKNLPSFFKIIKYPEFPFFLLLIFPVLISILLFLSNIKGLNYRYFIPCQIGLIGFFVSIYNYENIKKCFNNVNIYLTMCIFFTSMWTYRNFSTEFFNSFKELKLPAGLNNYVLNEIKSSEHPIVTNQLSTFLYLKRNNTHNDIYFLRTNEDEILNFPNFSKELKPLTLNNLNKLNSFYYHFFKIGEYDIINFSPDIWANDNNFNCEKLSFHSNFYKLSKF